MDPLIPAVLASTITAVVAGSATEAGADAWQALKRVSRRLLGSTEETEELLTEAEQGIPDRLSAALLAAANDSPDAASALALFINVSASGKSSNVHNSVVGNVSGNVIQADHIDNLNL